MTKKSFYNKADVKLQRWSKTIGAAVAIITTLAGVCTWINSQFQTAVASQISDFRQEMEVANIRHEQSITRVELIALIEHDPENIAAIEKMGRYYFKDLNGDLYMTKKYSDWAHAYGGDLTIIIGDK